MDVQECILAKSESRWVLILTRDSWMELVVNEINVEGEFICSLTGESSTTTFEDCESTANFLIANSPDKYTYILIEV